MALWATLHLAAGHEVVKGKLTPQVPVDNLNQHRTWQMKHWVKGLRFRVAWVVGIASLSSQTYTNICEEIDRDHMKRPLLHLIIHFEVLQALYSTEGTLVTPALIRRIL